MDKVYTIGYQGRPKSEFLKLLNDNDIDHLIDVRSYPRSSMEEYSKKNLKDFLFKKSIMYKHMPELGGIRDEEYSDAMKKDEWKEAYSELKKIARDGRTVLMCMEKDPLKCHRRYITEELEKEGWEVVHIGKGGSWKERSLDDFT